MPETAWEKTRNFSLNTYSKALKPGFDKAWNTIDKLGAPVNKLSNKLGAEAFWPTTLDKESDKAARILRSFCKDGFYEGVDAAQAARAEKTGEHIEGPKGKQRVIKKIPEHVIKNAKALAIFTTMRTGLWVSGAGGSGVLVARNQETGEWSPPSGILLHTAGLGFMIGVDIYDCVIIINTYQALQAFTKLRCTLGGEVSAAAGPLSVGGILESEVHKRQAPVWTYLKSRGFYAGVQIDGTIVIERTDENEKFYGERIPVSDILAGKARMPPREQYQMLTNTLRAAQGDAIDETLLPNAGEPTPGDQEVETDVTTFGIPEVDDPDPYGVKALETQGIQIREAATHERPSAEVFEFKPATTSPIYANFRKSVESPRRASFPVNWRSSMASVASRATQTDDEASPVQSPVSKRSSRQPSPVKDSAESKTLHHVVEEDGPVREAIEQQNSAEELMDESGSIKEEKGDSRSLHDPALTNGTHITNHVPNIPPVGTTSSEERDDGDIDDDDDESTYVDRSGASTPDLDEEIEIHEAKPVVAQAKVVTIAKRLPPSLPPRNPQRSSIQSRDKHDSMTNSVENDSLDGEHDANSTAGDSFHSIPPSPAPESAPHVA